MATIKQDAIAGLKAHIDGVVQEVDGIPGLQFYAVNKNGDYVFEHNAGKIGLGKQQDVGPNNVFWLASCTKLITAVACMQLVEQGKLTLDDVDLVERLAPELKEKKVLDEDGNLVDKKRGITLRMLLSHTAGFSYSFYNTRIAEFFGPIGISESSGNPEDYLEQPLVYQPGEKHSYGINLDWVGILITRASGLSLEDYFKQHITGPMGIDQDISFLPDQQMLKDLMYTHVRDPAGKIRLREDGHLQRAPLMARTKEQKDRVFQQGGAGTFARPRAYCQILAMLLNDGLHAPSGNRILKQETVEQMFTNQLPDMPDFARAGSNSTKPEYSNSSPEYYPEPGNPPQGWGISFFLHLSDSMVHGKGTGWWAGLPNLFWWCDRGRGLGGIIASQIVPFGDLKVANLWGAVEAGLYANLVQP